MRIKNLPSIESMDGSQDALVIEQTDGSEDKSRKVSPAQLKQYVLGEVDEVPTEDSDNLVKSGGIFSTMGVPRVDTANRRMYLEGGAAFDGNIDSSPTASSNNAVASGGTKTYVDNAVSERIKCGVITSGQLTATMGNHMFLEIPLSSPLPSSTVALFIIATPNSAWVFGNIQDYNSSRIRIGVYNTHPSVDITGEYKVAYLYT